MSEIDGSAAPVAAAVEAPSAPIAPAPAPEPVNVTAPPIATVDQPSLHEPPKPSKDGVVPRELDWAPDAQPAGIAELFGQAREGAQPLPPLDPIAMPRSWAKEHAERWAKLDRETQEIVSARENDRDAEVRRVQNERAEFQRRIEGDLQRFQGEGIAQLQTEAKKQAVVDLWGALRPELRSYGVNNAADWERLQKESPQRAQQYLEHWQRIAAVQQAVEQIERERVQQHAAAQVQHAQVMQQRQTEARQQFDAMLEQMDDAAHEKIEGGCTEEAQDRAVKYFEAIGGDIDELGRWMEASPHIEMLIHHPVFQQILDHAARYHAGQQRLKEIRPVRKPPPLSPGTLNGSGGRDTSLARLAQMGDMAGYIAARNSGARR